jgi:cytochrome c-type biogenesis protein CcmH/NrfF
LPSRLRAGVLAGLLFSLSLPADAAETCFDPAEYETATRTILCDCGCHPQSVHDCACGRAAEMRDEIRTTMAEQCLSADELVALYVERHGEQIRVAPTATGFNLVAWLGPSLGLLSALALMLVVLRRWSRRHPAVGTEAAPVEPLDPDYRERLRRALEGLE